MGIGVTGRGDNRRKQHQKELATSSRFKLSRGISMAMSDTKLGQVDESNLMGQPRLLNQQHENRNFVFGRGALLLDVSQLMSKQLKNRAGSDYGYDIEEHTDTSLGDQGYHTSTCRAGGDGCTAFVFQKNNLINFLKENQGVLLSLLGLKVVF